MALDQPPLVPARILNEHVYCPRLAYLEWVDREFVDNADTAEGTFLHRRTDRRRGAPPSPGDASGSDTASPRSTSVEIASDRLGLIAKIDVLDVAGEGVVPVEVKRGRPRENGVPLWEPELVQLCAQALILRDAGYQVPYAEAYFAETRTRHRIEITSDLEHRTLAAVADLRASITRGTPPAPLVDSPKCPRCSLVGICLPDEINSLHGRSDGKPRRLVAPDPAAKPLYASTPGSRITKRGGRLIALEDGQEVASRRLIDVSHIAVLGNVTIGSAVLRACFDAGIPVLWLTAGGWLSGFASGMPSKNVTVRMRQHRAAAVGAVELAAAFVAGKLRNQRTLLRRHGSTATHRAVAQLSALAKAAEREPDPASLLGIEGTGARIYFERFGSLLRSDRAAHEFAFNDRNRRPPRDPVNALLSFTYALLTKDAVIAALAAGLDPYIGLYHRPGFGRPALALDLMEEMRPLVGDSTVLMVINNGEIREQDFVRRAGAVALTAGGRKKVIAAYERRMRTELRHPLFGYKTSYRRAFEIQARLLAAVLTGSAERYRPLTTR
jgi:CRISPR-associated protein Cas1